MHIAQQPAPLHITHDVFDGGKGHSRIGLVAHCQPDTGQNLANQYQCGDKSKEVHKVEVLWRVIFGDVLLPGLCRREALVNPSKKIR